ncbi:MAG: TonB-dependent receptor plug domain-containing protein [Steroidobacteraceae bacterium]
MSWCSRGHPPWPWRPEQQAAAQDSSAGTIEEIIVTAQRREESLQATPIAITAFSTRELETQRVSNVMDLLNKVPSLNLAPFAGTRAAPNLYIRGMGNLTGQSTKDIPTGIYIDGVPVGRNIGLALDMADLERVEVLRGPQGTLWGRNTTAGAINFITRKPDDDLAFGVQLTAGSWDQRSGRANGQRAAQRQGLRTRLVHAHRERRLGGKRQPGRCRTRSTSTKTARRKR